MRIIRTGGLSKIVSNKEYDVYEGIRMRKFVALSELSERDLEVAKQLELMELLKRDHRDGVPIYAPCGLQE